MQSPKSNITKIVALMLFTLSAVTFSMTYSGEASVFERVKKRLESSPQTQVSFLNLVVSDIFETVDTTAGEIAFTKDGLYVTRIGTEQFIFDGSCLWEYSELYNQATRNCVEAGQSVDESFLFFLSLDRDYITEEKLKDSVYVLRAREGAGAGAPDSMTVTIDAEGERIVRFEYFDINQELNRIIILDENYQAEVDSSLFQADFPDSTEIIYIPG